jgi:HPt (histidine-containing phosphotransfer) domain-containing protein
MISRANGGEPVDLRDLLPELPDRTVALELIEDCAAYLRAQIEELRSAVRSGNEKARRRIAHAIRGGAAVLHAEELGTAAAALEQSETDSQCRRRLGVVEHACKRVEDSMQAFHEASDA